MGNEDLATLVKPAAGRTELLDNHRLAGCEGRQRSAQRLRGRNPAISDAKFGSERHELLAAILAATVADFGARRATIGLVHGPLLLR
jgi:hypothetical protein